MQTKRHAVLLRVTKTVFMKAYCCSCTTFRRSYVRGKCFTGRDHGRHSYWPVRSERRYHFFIVSRKKIGVLSDQDSPLLLLPTTYYLLPLPLPLPPPPPPPLLLLLSWITVLPSHSCGGTLQSLDIELLHSSMQTSADKNKAVPFPTTLIDP